MFFWTETPLTELWRQLRYLRSPANVKNLLIGKTKSGRSIHWPDSPDTELQAYSISACIKQAEEYYSAAEQVGLSTEPLLQYYGALSLAKAICLSSDPNTRLEHLNYHGLKAPKPWQIAPQSNGIEDRSAVIDEGVFRVLCSSIGEPEVPAKGANISLREILKVIPELSELYSRHYGESSNCIDKFNIQDSNGIMVINFPGAEQEQILRLFPEFGNGFTPILNQSKFLGFRSSAPLTAPLTFLRQVEGAAGGRYLVRILENGPALSFCLLFCALFILSDLVRYRPDFWMKVLDGFDTGSATILEALTDLARRKMPHDALQFIWKEKFTFGMSSYWG